ncbi:unnamed protein product, partial [Polarella glacialis]
VGVASGSAAKSSAGRASMAPRDIASVGRGLFPTQVRETRADAGNQVLHLQRLGADDGPKRLKVQMQSARLLHGADLGSRSFSCSVMVSGRQYSRLQTGQASGGHQAVWNYEGEIRDYAPGEDLEFLLSSKSSHSGDLEGSCTLLSEQFFLFGFSSEITVSSPGQGILGLLRVSVTVPK